MRLLILILSLALCEAVQATTNLIVIPIFGITTIGTNTFIDTNAVLSPPWWEPANPWTNNPDLGTNGYRTNLTRANTLSTQFTQEQLTNAIAMGLFSTNDLFSVMLWQAFQAQNFMDYNFDRSVFTRGVSSNGLSNGQWFTNTSGKVGAYLFTFSEASATAIDVRALVDDNSDGTFDYSVPYGEPASITGPRTNSISTPDINPGGRVLFTNLSGATGISEVFIRK